MTADTATTVCTIIKIERKDGQVFGLTDLDRDISYGGDTYVSASGYTPTNYEADAGLSIGNADISGLFDAAGISLTAARAGLFDHADITITLFDWEAGTPVRQLASGWWGEVTLKATGYTAEFRSLTQALSGSVVRTFAPTCDATFCDSRCGLDIATYTVSGTVSAVDSRLVFTSADLTSADNDEYRFGTITFDTGANAGVSIDIKRSSGATGELTLYAETPYDVEVGDTFTARQGCAKTKEACVAYNNIDNFRGFPNVPSQDEAIKIQGR